MAKQKKDDKLIANNKKAYHDFFILDTYEAGIALHGTEVKSLRMGKCSIKESFIRIENGEVLIYGMHVSPYEKGNIFNKDPLRVKKLLLHKAEINKLLGEIADSEKCEFEDISTKRVWNVKESSETTSFLYDIGFVRPLNIKRPIYNLVKILFCYEG